MHSHVNVVSLASATNSPANTAPETMPRSSKTSAVHGLFEFGTIAAVLGIAAFGLVGLAAAMLGNATPTVVMLIAVPVWLALIWLWRPHRELAGARQARTWTILAGLLIIVAATLVNLRYHGEYVLTNRDPGIYSNGGAWIAQHGTLVVDSRSGVLDDVGSVQANALGQQSLAGDDTRLEIQGAHVFPVLLALGYWVAGAYGLFAVPALLGGVAMAVLFVAGLRFLPDWVALTVMTGLAVNFAFVYTVRSVLSEPLMLLFAFAGLVFTAQALADRSVRRLLVAGFVVSVSLAVRLDAGVGVLLFLPVVAFLIARTHRRNRGVGSAPWTLLGCYFAGWIIPATLGLIDLHVFSPFYVFFHKEEFALVQAGLIAAVVTAAVAMAFATLSASRANAALQRTSFWWRARASTTGTALAFAVVALAAFAWWLRPILWQLAAPAGIGKAAMQAIQKREGLPLNGDRTYDELSVTELVWYLGPLVLVAAVLGIAVLIRRFVLGRLQDDLSLLLALVVPISVLYLFRTGIYPDQPWAIRRFLPITIPGLLLFAGWFAVWFIERSERGGLLANPAYRQYAYVAVVSVALVPPLAVSWPLKSARWEAGGISGMERLCSAVGPDGVAILSLEVGPVMLPAVRGFCAPGVAAATVGKATAPNVVDTDSLSAKATKQDRKVTVIASSSKAVLLLAPRAVNVHAVPILNTTEVVSTVERPPTQTAPFVWTLWVGDVPARR